MMTVFGPIRGTPKHSYDRKLLTSLASHSFSVTARSIMATPQTLYEKIWAAHVVERRDDGTCLIYIDRHLVHEVTSPQAFEGLRAAGRKVRRPDLTLAVPDHNLPTTARKDAAGRVLHPAQIARVVDVPHEVDVGREDLDREQVRKRGHGLHIATHCDIAINIRASSDGMLACCAKPGLTGGQ